MITMRIRLLLAATVIGAGALAGCGGGETVINVTVTTRATPATTPSVPATTPTPTTPTSTVPEVPTTTDLSTTPTTPEPGTTTEPGGISDLEARFPPPGLVKGMAPGPTTRKPNAKDMVTALFSAGDPGIPAATARLEAAGYEDGLLRDETATTTSAPVLVRTYVMRLRDAAAARTEVDDAVDEVIETSPKVTFTPVALDGDYGRAIKTTVGGQGILMVTWVAGRDVYGIQIVGKANQLNVEAALERASEIHLAYNDG